MQLIPIIFLKIASLKLEAPMLQCPPEIFQFEEVEQGQVLESPPSEELAEYESFEMQVPSFMTVNSYVYHTLQRLTDEIFQDHRCNNCSKYLCCGATIHHDVNCWYHEFCYEMSFVKLRQIRTYRLDVFNGCMKEWEAYAYEPFDKKKHIKDCWGAHHFGFYVRCFECVHCTKDDGRKCHALYHHH